MDLIGSVLVGAAMLLVMHPLVKGRELGWPQWTYVSMVASLPVLVLFAVVQIRKGRAHRSPLVEMTLFRKKPFNGGVVIAFLFFATLIGFFFVFMLYLQIGRGFEVMHAGLTVLPWSLGMAVGSAVSGAVLAPKLGRKLLSIGALVMGVAFIGVIWTLDREGAHVSSLQLMPSLLVAGLGMGAVVASLFGIVLAAVKPREIGSASGLVSAVNQVGAAAGIALLGVFFFTLLGHQATGAVDRVTPQLRAEMQAAHVPAATQDNAVERFRTCYHDRMAAPDVTEAPASCRTAHPDQGVSTAGQTATAHKDMTKALERAGSRANGENFTLAIQRTLWCAAGAMALVFLLSFVLPPRARSWG